jgi:formiminotetrahydrofolate cyclodeaminase
MQYCKRIAEIGNRNVLSDVATGAMLAAGAGDGAAWMVRTNVRAMKDQELVHTLNQRLSKALDSIATYKQQVASSVGDRA